MKKIFAVFLCLFFLCACGKKENVESVLSGVSFDAVVEFGGYETTCTVKAYGGGVFSCEITDPENIKGTVIDFNGDSIKITYMGLEYETEPPMPCRNVAEILNAVVSLAAQNTASLDKDGHYKATGRTGSYTYEIMVTQAGLPLEIICEDIDFKAEIINASIIK